MSNVKFLISNIKLIFACYLLIIVGLFFYSYTQVDLNLTLSKVSVWQYIQKAFQNIGWFQRDLSTNIYLVLVFLLAIFYFFILQLIKHGQMSEKQFWKLLILTSIILLFSYNAFSYDLFNYLFDARIVTTYGQSPYEHAPWDFQGDPWLNFMRWIHRKFPYGPVWLLLTVPLSFAGGKVFLPTLFLFKALMAASFLGSVFFIGKILKKVFPQEKLLGMAFFAFNPLVIIESLVSAHNDIVMVFFTMLFFWELLNKNYFRLTLSYIASVGIKYATIFLFPVVILALIKRNNNQEHFWRTIFFLSLLSMIPAVVVASFRTNFQPWYMLSVLPFAAFLTNKYYVVIPSVVISLFSLMHYVPFLKSGNWDPPIPTILFFLTFSSIIVSIILTAGIFGKRLLQKRSS